MAEENLKRKFFKRAAIGFLIGLPVGNLIAIIPDLIRRTPPMWVTEALIRRMGSFSGALVIQSLFSGLIGAVGIVGMTFYEIDSWSMPKSALIHYLMILAVFLPCAWFLGWIGPEGADALIMAGIMAAAYALIWLFMYLYYRKEVAEMNSFNSESSKNRT